MSGKEERERLTGDAGGEPLRRRTLGWLAGAAMGGALVAAYGTFAAFIGRFVYPARPANRGWMFVTRIDDVAAGESFVFRLPNGSGVNVTRRDAGGGPAGFIALSSTCPHLGCQVHWESQNGRFFCPCHNGTFNPEGVATGGPPGDAGQSLLQFPLREEGGILFIEVEVEQLARGPGRIERATPRARAGHDPCLDRGRLA
jgi:Rieske Fe-S protein